MKYKQKWRKTDVRCPYCTWITVLHILNKVSSIYAQWEENRFLLLRNAAGSLCSSVSNCSRDKQTVFILTKHVTCDRTVISPNNCNLIIPICKKKMQKFIVSRSQHAQLPFVLLCHMDRVLFLRQIEAPDESSPGAFQQLIGTVSQKVSIISWGVLVEITVDPEHRALLSLESRCAKGFRHIWNEPVQWVDCLSVQNPSVLGWCMRAASVFLPGVNPACGVLFVLSSLTQWTSQDLSYLSCQCPSVPVSPSHHRCCRRRTSCRPLKSLHCYISVSFSFLTEGLLKSCCHSWRLSQHSISYQTQIWLFCAFHDVLSFSSLLVWLTANHETRRPSSVSSNKIWEYVNLFHHELSRKSSERSAVRTQDPVLTWDVGISICVKAHSSLDDLEVLKST